jgi:hypothetical protein
MPPWRAFDWHLVYFLFLGLYPAKKNSNPFQNVCSAHLLYFM